MYFLTMPCRWQDNTACQQLGSKLAAPEPLQLPVSMGRRVLFTAQTPEEPAQRYVELLHG
jgi:hypothetical protein